MIKFARFIMALAAVAALAAAPPSFGEGKVDEARFAPVSELSVGDIEHDPEMKKSFSIWLEALHKGDEASSFAETNRMLEGMNRLGTRNLYPLSDACIALARSALTGGDAAKAVTAARYATFFAPDSAQAHFFLARAIFAKNKADVSAAGMSAFTGFKKLLTDRIQRDLFISQAALYMLLAVGTAFVITFIALFAQSHQAVLSNITSFFPAAQHGFWRPLVGAMVILAPLAVGGWQIFIISLPLFLWPCSRRGARVLMVIFAAFVLSAPYLFMNMARGAAMASADTYRSLYLLSQSTWDHDTKLALERERARNPEDTLVAFALGLLNKSRKDRPAAVEAFDAALAQDPRDIRTLINKGNAYYVAREYEDAVAMYREAMEADPQSVEAHFNLSVTFNEMLRTKDSEGEYNKANVIDPKRTQELVELTKDQEHDRKVVDFPITDADLKSYEQAAEERTMSVGASMWSVYFGAITMKTYLGITAGFIALLALSHVYWMRRVSHEVCSSCASPFLPPIKLGPELPQCNQCVAAQITKAGVSSAKKDKKRKEIRESKERRRMAAVVMDRIIPGAGRIYAHEYISGLLFSVLTSMILVYGAGFIMPDLMEREGAMTDALKLYIPFIAVAAVYWALMNTALKREFY
ncbi:MAG: tetratricopeptide repeat protein [Nitrospinae bacterium]|nr:tetratricopeptide repeat protein [Nitrospinota bacterium]